jgi:hypothetical protein
MIGKILFTLSLFLTCLNNSIAQKEKVENKLLFYSPLRAFFQQHPSLKEIEINNWKPGVYTLGFVTKDSILKREYFDLGFEGDKYLFEKKLGKWNFPDSLILPLIDKKAIHYNASVKARYDSIFLKLVHYYPRGKDEWYFFDVIKDSIRYLKGMNMLEKELQTSIQHISPEERLTDSVFIFNALLKKDSTLTLADQITSENETYAKALTAILNRSYPWKPYNHGGRNVHVYTRIYIKINNNKTVRVAIREP